MKNTCSNYLINHKILTRHFLNILGIKLFIYFHFMHNELNEVGNGAGLYSLENVNVTNREK